MVYIHETQISRLLAVLGHQPHAFPLRSNPHCVQAVTCDSWRLSPVLPFGLSPVLTLAPLFRIGGLAVDSFVLVAIIGPCWWHADRLFLVANRPMMAALTGPCGYVRLVVLKFFTMMFVPAAFAVAAHFTTSRRVIVLVDLPIAASISWSIVVVLFKRSSNGQKTK